MPTYEGMRAQVLACASGTYALLDAVLTPLTKVRSVAEVYSSAHSTALSGCYAGLGVSSAPEEGQAMGIDQMRDPGADASACPCAQAMRFLTVRAKQALAEPCVALLEVHIAGALAQNVELLSDEGRDRMFVGVSSLLAKVYLVLREVMDPADADLKVRISGRHHARSHLLMGGRCSCVM